jgi:hypothetical protein
MPCIVLLSIAPMQVDFEVRKLIAYSGQSTVTDTAIENLNVLTTKGLELVEIAAKQLEKNGDKLFGNLTAKNMNKWASGFQRLLVKAVSNDS